VLEHRDAVVVGEDVVLGEVAAKRLSVTAAARAANADPLGYLRVGLVIRSLRYASTSGLLTSLIVAVRTCTRSTYATYAFRFSRYQRSVFGERS
jgi:hypothetical protein